MLEMNQANGNKNILIKLLKKDIFLVLKIMYLKMKMIISYKLNAKELIKKYLMKQ